MLVDQQANTASRATDQDDYEDQGARARERRISWIPWLRSSCWLSLSSGVLYVALRALFLLQAERVCLMEVLSFVVELSAVLLRSLSQIGTLIITRRIHQNALQSTTGIRVDLPRVDVFITYCGEDLNLLMDTLRAISVQDYPKSLFRTIILDDSASSEVPALIPQLESEGRANIFYTTRGVTVRTHSKAGNLNHGLFFIDQLDGEHAEYIAVLDVDMIPEPCWLETVMTYILNDPKVGLANPFQNFYNLPSSDRLGHLDLIRSLNTMLVLQDLAGNSSCTGSGFVVRREALDQIGGFPTGSFAEDILLSIRLTAEGWGIRHVPGKLQWGLGPDTFSGFVKQRQRLAIGQVSNALRICAEHAHKYNLSVRISIALWAGSYLASACIWSLNMVLLPALLFSGRPLLPRDNIKMLSALAFLDFVSKSSYEICVSSQLDFEPSLLGNASSTWISPYVLSAVLRSLFLPKILGLSDDVFGPSGKSSAHGHAERQARRQRTSCLKLIAWDCGAWLHLTVFLACVTAPMLLIKQSLSVIQSNTFRETVLGAMQSVLWPPLFSLWIIIIKAAWTPVAYGLFPPPDTPREKLLHARPGNGVLYPNRQAKEKASEKVPQTTWYLIGIYQLLAFYIVQRYS